MLIRGACHVHERSFPRYRVNMSPSLLGRDSAADRKMESIVSSLHANWLHRHDLTDS